ncbi:hypothetical protein [uncultured Azohydromonas sp.]|uniref:hypothetical protein n=1 Tax=uncultured Azohydromonas sp. TaxID=487342 RepID=UPI002612CC89|nr:hypothetical protein [uncultured Azohydromonas sp.]
MSKPFSLLSNEIMPRDDACNGASTRFACHGGVDAIDALGIDATASGLTACFNFAIDCQPSPVVDGAGSAATAH